MLSSQITDEIAIQNGVQTFGGMISYLSGKIYNFDDLQMNWLFLNTIK